MILLCGQVFLVLFWVHSDFRYEMHKALRTPDILEIIFRKLDILSLASANDCCEVVGDERFKINIWCLNNLTWHQFSSINQRLQLDTIQYHVTLPQDICHEFVCSDEANAWRKSTKEADKDKYFLLQLRK